jgi:hypothetical protein
MKFCQPHWDKLGEAIKARGLNHLVAANDREAHARTVADLKGESDLSDYDPLMDAHWMIVGATQRRIGLALFFGDVCPVCAGIETNAGMVDPKLGRMFTAEDEESYWIDGPADAVLAFCREHGIAEATR